MTLLNFQFPGPGTAAFFAAALGIFAAYQVKHIPEFFWIVTAFSLLALAAGLAVEFTDPQRKPMTWRSRLPLILVQVATAIVLAVAFYEAIKLLSII